MSWGQEPKAQAPDKARFKNTERSKSQTNDIDITPQIVDAPQRNSSSSRSTPVTARTPPVLRPLPTQPGHLPDTRIAMVVAVAAVAAAAAAAHWPAVSGAARFRQSAATPAHQTRPRRCITMHRYCGGATSTAAHGGHLGSCRRLPGVNPKTLATSCKP